jgi:hypothetical protein
MGTDHTVGIMATGHETGHYIFAIDKTGLFHFRREQADQVKKACRAIQQAKKKK